MRYLFLLILFSFSFSASAYWVPNSYHATQAQADLALNSLQLSCALCHYETFDNPSSQDFPFGVRVWNFYNQCPTGYTGSPPNCDDPNAPPPFPVQCDFTTADGSCRPADCPSGYFFRSDILGQRCVVYGVDNDLNNPCVVGDYAASVSSVNSCYDPSFGISPPDYSEVVTPNTVTQPLPTTTPTPLPDNQSETTSVTQETVTNPDGSTTNTTTSTTTNTTNNTNNNSITTTVTTTTINPDGTSSTSEITTTSQGTEVEDENSNDSSASGGDTCNSPPSSTGDAIQSAQLLQIWKVRCEPLESTVTGSIENCDTAFQCTGDAVECINLEFQHYKFCEAKSLADTLTDDFLGDSLDISQAALESELGAAPLDSDGQLTTLENVNIDIASIIDVAGVFNQTQVAASCPAPYPLPLAIGGMQSFSYEPFCDVLEALNPLVITIFSFLASLMIYRGITESI